MAIGKKTKKGTSGYLNSGSRSVPCYRQVQKSSKIPLVNFVFSDPTINWDIRNNHPINKDGPVRSAKNGTFSSLSLTHTHTHTHTHAYTHTHTQTPPFSHAYSREQWSQHLVNARETKEREIKTGRAHSHTHTHTRTIARDRLTGGALARVLEIEKTILVPASKADPLELGSDTHTHKLRTHKQWRKRKETKREGPKGF